MLSELRCPLPRRDRCLSEPLPPKSADEVSLPTREPTTPTAPRGSADGKRFSRHHGALKKPQDSVAQMWFQARLSGTSPADFHPDGIAIYTTLPMSAPSEFQKVTNVIRPDHTLGLQEINLLAIVPAILIFCDIYDEEQVQLVRVLENAISDLAEDCPPTILVPHDSASQQQGQDAEKEITAMIEVLKKGADRAIIGEPEGLKLASAVRSEIMGQHRHCEHFKDCLLTRQEKVADAWQLAESVHDIVWDYLRVRSRTRIPLIDFALQKCRPGMLVGNFRVGREVGHGGSGSVYRFHRLGGDVPVTDVLKVLPKLVKVASLHSINNEIRVMQLLSTEACSHPNIIKLHGVFHSRTEVWLQMEDGGPRNLYNYLHAHDRKHAALGAKNAGSIIRQCVGALSHMHLVAKIVHRDIKPENILVDQVSNGLAIKICDFDLARVVRPEDRHMSICGTFPFLAPEILRSRPYFPFPIDIWSMGMVFLEVLCCCQVVVQAVIPKHHKKALDPQKEEEIAAGLIFDFFEQPTSIHRILDLHQRPDLRGTPESSHARALLEGMMVVSGAQRFTAERLQETYSNHSDP